MSWGRHAKHITNNFMCFVCLCLRITSDIKIQLDLSKNNSKINLKIKLVKASNTKNQLKVMLY